MAVSATVTPGKIFTDGEAVTISDLNKLGSPTVDISGAVGTLSLSDGSVTNAKVAASAGVQLNKLETGTDAQVIVANSSGEGAWQTISGDATVDNAGAMTIAAGAVEESMLAAGVNTVPTGCISLWYTAAPPSGWLVCDGSTFDATTYADLDTLLGGNTLPNLQGRIPVGRNGTSGTFNVAVGTAGGAETHQLTEGQMPKHYHLMLGPSSVTSPQGSGSSSGVYGGGTPDDSTQAYGTYSTGGSASSGSQTTGTGNGDSFGLLQPYVVLNYIIKT